jgi:hypothetical protein
VCMTLSTERLVKMKVSIRIAVILLIFLSVRSTRTNAQSDESGTLVMVARTTTGIVVSVDSAITTKDPVTLQTSVVRDPSRKLIDFAQYGACTIDAFTGESAHGNILANQAREWLKANPAAKGFEALNGILVVAATSWNSEHYVPSFLGVYPGDRRVGDLVSHIVCGDLIGNDFMIIQGDTTLAADGTASISRAVGIGASFELGGFFDYQMLLGLSDNKDAGPGAKSDLARAYPAVRQEMLSDPKVVQALKSFINEQKRTTDFMQQHRANPVMPPPALEQSQVQTLFAAAYKSVEENTRFVSAPNNVRLLSKCGRVSTTVEEKWTICNQ